MQGETIKMRRDETIMSAMSQEKCCVRRLQEGFQVEAIRGGYVCEQSCTSKSKTKYGPQFVHISMLADSLQILYQLLDLQTMSLPQVPPSPMRPHQRPAPRQKQISQCKIPSSTPRRRLLLQHFQHRIAVSKISNSITVQCLT